MPHTASEVRSVHPATVLGTHWLEGAGRGAWGGSRRTRIRNVRMVGRQHLFNFGTEAVLA